MLMLGDVNLASTHRSASRSIRKSEDWIFASMTDGLRWGMGFNGKSPIYGPTLTPIPPMRWHYAQFF